MSDSEVDTWDIALTAMIPCFNEIECIDQVYAQVAAELSRYRDSEILFIDDGSTDGTLDAIRSIAAADPRVRYLSFSRNFGLEAAFTAGFRYASKPWTVQMDADLQSPPSQIHALVARALQGYDAVFAVREQRQDTWLRRAGSNGYQAIATRALGIELPLGASTFRVVRTSVARKIVALRLDQPFFLATVPLVGARYTTMVTPHQARHAGVGKWPLRRLFAHAIELFVGFSYRPVELIYALAGAGCVTAAVTLVLAMAGAIGPLGVAAVAVALGAAALLALAVLAVYQIRSMRGHSGLPRYLIAEANIPIEPIDSLYEHESDVWIRTPAGAG